MLIYKKENSKSFTSVDLENKKVSTRSSYPKTFFRDMDKGTYSMFSFKEVHVVEANERYITFVDNGDSIYSKKDPIYEVYHYIGEASNKEELLQLLELNKEIN